MNYGSVYNKPFWTAGDPTTAPMKVYQTRTEGTSGNENCRHKADVDHIVEAQSIIEFFSGPNPKPTFIDQAKWDSLVSAVMTGTPETKNPPAPATPGFKELGTALGALNNLQAIDARVNSMKGKIMAKVSNSFFLEIDLLFLRPLTFSFVNLSPLTQEITYFK